MLPFFGLSYQKYVFTGIRVQQKGVVIGGVLSSLLHQASFSEKLYILILSSKVRHYIVLKLIVIADVRLFSLKSLSVTTMWFEN